MRNRRLSEVPEGIKTSKIRVSEAKVDVFNRGDSKMYRFHVDVYSRKITTSSAEAQAWFDRGLVWTYSYNHEQAIECFQKALEHDPKCAMAHWGVAYAIGPNYNFEWWMMDPDTKSTSLATAFDSTQAALALVDNLTEPERALIEALPARYRTRAAVPYNSMCHHTRAGNKRSTTKVI